ncbi:hypothetical protein [Gracilimonas sediminicola]|uniref:Uncharacterized protein n=1 Tax=Gracilimonas sediminicola TaxID=2952158 RepID=A0A9X2L4U6_9BACT|nr:hypothetical protein [Gracilimonas sediminicola]MCP9292295.1 hypothetical protein [Gracilimonas sediminicola]
MKKIKDLVAYLTNNQAIDNAKIQSINGVSSLLMYSYLRIDFDVVLIKEIILVDVYFVLLTILVNFGFEIKGLEYINQKLKIEAKKKVATSITVIRLGLLIPGLIVLIYLLQNPRIHLIVLFLLKILSFIFINAYYYLSADKLKSIANKYFFSFVVSAVVTLSIVFDTKNIEFLAFYYSGMFVVSTYFFFKHIRSKISILSLLYYLKKNLKFFPIYTSSVFIKELNIPLMNMLGVGASKIELYNLIDKMIRMLVSGIRPLNQVILNNYHKLEVKNLRQYLLRNISIHVLAHGLFLLLVIALYNLQFLELMELFYVLACSSLIYFSLYNYIKISISNTAFFTTTTIILSGITGLSIIYFFSKTTFIFIVLAYVVPEITLSLLLNRGSKWLR